MSEYDAMAVVDAFEQLGVPAGRNPSSEAEDHGVDLVLDPDGVQVELELKRYALVDEPVALGLVQRHESASMPSDEHRRATLVVADRVTEGAKDVLLKGNCGYLDLRGQLGLRTPWVIVIGELDLPREAEQRSEPLAGRAGLELAAELLMHPARAAGVRELARSTGRSPSTVSNLLTAMRSTDLIDASNRVVGADLFWQLADRWPTHRTYLHDIPSRDAERTAKPLRLGLHQIRDTPGWALTDLAAAAELGAPVAVRSDQVLDFFVPDEAIARRARTLLGVALGAEQARCSVRVAPVPSVCTGRVNPSKGFYGWPTAHPVFVALDLAHDRGRGREVLSEWIPSGDFSRVW